MRHSQSKQVTCRRAGIVVRLSNVAAGGKIIVNEEFTKIKI